MSSSKRRTSARSVVSSVADESGLNDSYDIFASFDPYLAKVASAQRHESMMDGVNKGLLVRKRRRLGDCVVGGRKRVVDRQAGCREGEEREKTLGGYMFCPHVPFVSLLFSLFIFIFLSHPRRNSIQSLPISLSLSAQFYGFLSPPVHPFGIAY